MVSGWTGTEEPDTPGAGTVTLIEGSSFCVCESSGDVHPGGSQGVFAQDTRLVSKWELRVDDEPVEPLTVMPGEPFRATFVGRAHPRPGRADSTLLVERRRLVGGGMREDIVVRNLSGEPAGCAVTLSVGSDLADLFDVKGGRVPEPGVGTAAAEGCRLRFTRESGDRSRGVCVESGEAVATPSGLFFRVAVPARGTWQTTIQVHPVIDGHELPARFPIDRPVEQTAPARRLRAWQRGSPQVSTRHRGLAHALRRSGQDLGALRIFDPDHPRSPVVAAGAPWFMTLFGRDSLLASWMALPFDQSLALGTLQTLARLQGTKVDPLTEEEPGKILHEMRFGAETDVTLGASRAYYGSIDATPLFVMLLGELRRWGLAREEVDVLLPHADRALAWIERYGDRDGDGFVEYQRATDRGLLHQGWKDSFDGVGFADGRLADPPIALAEVQGYVYAAYVARAHFAREAGDEEAACGWAEKAARLRRAFNERFWLPDRGWYAMGLDRDKRPIDALASNMGHCLWTGIVDEDKAPSVAEHLMSPEMFGGWGVRTLSSAMAAYNPMSYHNGSVWPHDSALTATGLMRYGFVSAAQRLALGLLDATDAFGGRPPELFCGFDRGEYPKPVPYPTSCSPQAWAAASPVQLLRTLLRLDPWVPQGKVWVAPALPHGFEPLRVSRLPLGDARLTIEAHRDGLHVTGLPPAMELVRAPRAPLTAFGAPAVPRATVTAEL